MNAALLANARRTVGVITRHTDLLLVALTVAVITLMIVPLPTAMIDTLIGANMALSFVMLMMSMYVKGPLHFSSFPTMLLFTTLFRVGLNIATTRLILLQADAGEIIFTFGEFAVGGNFIVGAVVFIILTIIQFLVVAKGAERVSEVGARFTLDAMPGKQMSIDADLRAGTIDMEEAQRRRQEVAQESQMFGAMDGAMKFVKGDSIAGIIVAVVNILGGTLIGVTQNGISAGEALQLYGILTIGDGLVSQIPSLLVAISAGILVTRSGSDAGNVGAQIGGQIFAQPKALLVASCLIFLFAMIPGFPKAQLFALAFFLGGIGYTLKHLQEVKEAPDYRQELAKAMKPAAGRQQAARPGAPREEFSPVVPIILDTSPQLIESLDYEVLNDELSALRRALYFDLGVPFPGINIRPNPGLAELSYHLLLNEIPVSRGRFEPGMVMVGENRENLQMLRLAPQEGHAFLPNTPSLWLPESDAELLSRAGLSYMTHPRLLAWHLSLVLSRHAPSFIGLQETKFLLDKMEERAPDLVREATRLMPIQRLSDIFQRLVSEQISIRDLRGILEAVIEWAPREKDVIMLVEYVRGALKRQISYRHTSGQNILSAFLLDPQLEEAIRKSIRQTSVGAFLSLPPETSRRLLDAVGAALGKFAKGQGPKPVLLASIDIRRYLRRLVETEYYELAVLSFQELTPEISVQPVDKILL
ncbi:MAG: type III secretion system export apparatus subunit SctV [Candidatus Accumulibacter sp.]|jgi:type III secretion protein V|nr:type III secretion system export apparatus subunit SctV [Accumulibacter sp.]